MLSSNFPIISCLLFQATTVAAVPDYSEIRLEKKCPKKSVKKRLFIVFENHKKMSLFSLQKWLSFGLFAKTILL